MAQTTSAQEADPVINVIEPDMPGNGGGPAPSSAHREPLDAVAMDAVSARRRREFDAARARLRAQAIREDRGEARQAGAQTPADVPGDVDRHRAPLEQLPERVRKRYLRAGNQYFLKDAPYQLAFEDLGPYLVTEHNRPDVVESMVDMAHAKSWQRIRVSGHEAFRSEVWLQATLLGIDVSGYEPKAADLARLADARQARLDNRIEVAADAAAASGTQGRNDSRPASTAAEPGGTRSGASGASPVVPESDVVPGPRTATGRNTAGDEPDVPRRYAGQLLEHGGAPYLHNPARSDSYYVVFRDQAGVDQAVWGVDLERAVGESGAGIGQQVVLENLGKRLVTVRVPIFDGAGTVVGEEDKDVYRNTWHVEAVHRAQDVSASPKSDNRPDGEARSSDSPAVPVTEPEPHHRRAAQRQEHDPAMHLAVLAMAMREQGFSDRSIARVQQRAERLLVAFGKDGTPVPTPRVFDPKAPSGRDQRRRSSAERAPAPEIDRALAEPSPLSPSR
ncbi:LPD7 domain-containing protein [Paraburkholderia sp. J41]|uniref:LPD7 domain-containing protein n=1 Tax=Paraburkholderia sp. J41 TaxID=2805433 RepID=UPI002AC3157F|nr:LPD7 domain-containing protein [Paraburkholderia sp. J41]